MTDTRKQWHVTRACGEAAAGNPHQQPHPTGPPPVRDSGCPPFATVEGGSNEALLKPEEPLSPSALAMPWQFKLVG